MSQNSDIWQKAIRTHVSWTLRDLLDYVDQTYGGRDRADLDPKAKAVKQQLHNRLRSLGFSLGSLFETYKLGGQIATDFEQDLQPNKEDIKKKVDNFLDGNHK